MEELEFVLTQSLNLELLIFKTGLQYYLGKRSGLLHHGAIFEVKADEVAMGSIGGGGRYDNLTEVLE